MSSADPVSKEVAQLQAERAKLQAEKAEAYAIVKR